MTLFVLSVLGSSHAANDPFAVRLGLSGTDRGTVPPAPSQPRPEERPELTEEEMALIIDDTFERLQRSIQRIWEMMAQQEFDRAARATDATLSTFGDVPPLLHLAGRIAMQRKDYEAAESYWERTAALDLTEMQRADLYSQWGGTIFSRGDMSRAVDMLRQAWELHPYQSLDTYALIAAHAALHQHSAAAELIQLLDLPELAQLLTLLQSDEAGSLERLGDEGIAWLIRALAAGGEPSLMPPEPVAPTIATQEGFLSLSDVPASQQLPSGSSLADPQRQLRIMERLLTRFSELFQAGDYESILALQTRLEQSRVRFDAPALQAGFAYVRYLAGDDAGIADLSRLTEIYPHSVPVGVRLATLYIETSRYEEAARTLRPLQQRHPQHPLVLLLLASSLAEAEQSPEALEVLNTMLPVLQRQISAWLSNPQPHHHTLLSDPHYAAWRQIYLGRE